MIYTSSKNEQKLSVGSKKNSRFCLGDIESCYLASARCVKLWSLNLNLFFKEPHQLTKFTYEVHLNNIWQRAFRFKDLIAVFWDLQTLWPKIKLFSSQSLIFSAECTIGMVWWLPATKALRCKL